MALPRVIRWLFTSCRHGSRSQIKSSGLARCGLKLSASKQSWCRRTAASSFWTTSSSRNRSSRRPRNSPICSSSSWWFRTNFCSTKSMMISTSIGLYLSRGPYICSKSVLVFTVLHWPTLMVKSAIDGWLPVKSGSGRVAFSLAAGLGPGRFWFWFESLTLVRNWYGGATKSTGALARRGFILCSIRISSPSLDRTRRRVGGSRCDANALIDTLIQLTVWK